MKFERAKDWKWKIIRGIYFWLSFSLSLHLLLCVGARQYSHGFFVSFFILCAFFNIYNVYCGIGPIAFKHIALGAMLKVARAQFPIVLFYIFRRLFRIKLRPGEKEKQREQKSEFVRKKVYLIFAISSLFTLFVCMSEFKQLFSQHFQQREEKIARKGIKRRTIRIIPIWKFLSVFASGAAPSHPIHEHCFRALFSSQKFLP